MQRESPREGLRREQVPQDSSVMERRGGTVGSADPSHRRHLARRSVPGELSAQLGCLG